MTIHVSMIQNFQTNFRALAADVVSVLLFAYIGHRMRSQLSQPVLA